MHITISVFIIFGIWRWADWKNWEKYQSTMLLAAVGNLLYEFLYYSRYPWIFKPEVQINYIIASSIYTFVILPGSALWFLSTAPLKLRKQIPHILKWTAVYVTIEAILIYFNIGKHYYGWNIWLSGIWDIMMFSVWLLHYKKPLWAYCISIIVVFLMVHFFPINVLN